jgi:hypothetical protein
VAKLAVGAVVSASIAVVLATLLSLLMMATISVALRIDEQ